MRVKVVSASRFFYKKFEALNTGGWRVSGKDGAAEILSINPKTLESKMQRLGIQRSKKNA